MRRSFRSLALAQVVLVLAACSAVPGTSSTPSSSPAPTSTSEPSLVADSAPPPSVGPSASGLGDGVGLPAVSFDPDSYARVVSESLRVRSKPEVSDDSKKLEPLLQDGQLLVVLDGPVHASGYDWYQVQPTSDIDKEVMYPFGWVAAASRDGERWIEPETVECPERPTEITSISRINAKGRMYFEVTCFGGQEFTFLAKLHSPDATCPVEVPWTWDPAWLGTCEAEQVYLTAVEDDVTGYTLWPAWTPEIDLSMAPTSDGPRVDWPNVDVTGQFDHPAAQDCRNRNNFDAPDSPEPDPALTILNCRAQFVVTSMKEID